MESNKIVTLESPEELRREFALKYCSKVYEYDGQACVIFTYQKYRWGDYTQVTVFVYDMDAARIFSTSPDEFIKNPVYRDSESADFEWSAILGSTYIDNACDISNLLFDNI